MSTRDGRLTHIIAGVTVAAFVLALLFSRAIDVPTVAGFIPATVGGRAFVGGALPWWITPLTATLVHGGILHLLFNMAMFVWVGRQVEPAIGAPQLAVLYIVGAYAAAAGQWALDPAGLIPMVGASGAISAVVALYALVFSESKTRAIAGIPAGVVRALWLGAAWVIIQTMLGFATGGMIAVGAHIGGFLAGLLLARPLLRWRYRR